MEEKFGHNISGKRNRKQKGMAHLRNYMLFSTIHEIFSGNKSRDIGKISKCHTKRSDDT